MILTYLMLTIDFDMILMEVQKNQEETANQRNRKEIINPKNIEKPEKINYKIRVYTNTYFT